jgi:hypothetical protein
VLKLIKFFSIIFCVLICILIAIGLFARPDTYITRTQVIKSPVAVVWRHLIDIDNYPAWQSEKRKVEINKGPQIWKGATLRYYLVAYDSTLFHEERVTALEQDNSITFLRSGINENPLFKDFKTSYTLKRLLDGTTEISVAVSYRTTSFITRIYNQLYLRTALGGLSIKNLAALRDLIESP